MRYKNIQKSLWCLSQLIVVGIAVLSFLSCTNPAGNEPHNRASSSSPMVQNTPKNFTLKLVTDWSTELNETSGLALVNNLIVSHNDKGGASNLYLIQTPKGELINTIRVNNVQNNDWEDVVYRDGFLYIGDTGNNKGTRKNLAVYKIPAKDLTQDKQETNSIAHIAYHFPEQKDFEKGKEHNYDCEALACFKDQLYLFSKNRLNQGTDVYSIPAKEGSFAAKHIGYFDTQGRVTGADMNASGNKLALLGYNKKSDCFLYILSHFKGTDFFSGQIEKITLGNYKEVGQMEGVCFINDSTLYLSAEASKTAPAKLHQLTLHK